MKKILCLLAFTGLVVVSSGQAPHYEITGNIEGAEGLVITLQRIVNGKTANVNAGTVTNGIFKIIGGKVEYPELVNLTVLDKKKSISFYLENSIITISGKFDSFSDLKIEGSKTQEEFKSLKDSLAPFTQKYEELGKKFEDANRGGNINKSNEIRKQAEPVINNMKQIQKNFLKNNPASFVAPDILSTMFNNIGLPEVESYLNAMDANVAGTRVAKELKEKVALLKNVEIGQKAPDFTMQDNKGNSVSLSSKIGTNILLIDFWAAWCAPCRAENPNVVKVFNEFNSKGFDILGVSLDQNELDWYKAISTDKLKWTQVSDLKYWNNAAAKLYGVRSIPASFLLDKNGIIIAKNLRGEDLYNKVKELISAK
jgi:peroxiredoxin